MVNYEIVYNNISQKYHMVEEGDPKGTSFGTGKTEKDCLHDAQIILGNLKEISEGIYTKVEVHIK